MKLVFASGEDEGNDAVCFHAQQCIEKLLKALCIENEIPFPKSHDLVRLLGLLSKRFPELTTLSERLKDLTELGLEFRYPDEFASRKDAEQALSLCSEIREVIKTALGPVEGMLFP